MKTKFTAQDIIDMGAKLFDEDGFSRADIRIFMNTLRDNGMWDASADTFERVYDLIVG